MLPALSVVAVTMVSVLSADRSPPPANGAVVLIFLVLGACFTLSTLPNPTSALVGLLTSEYRNTQSLHILSAEPFLCPVLKHLLAVVL